jgi:hypothetical protein
MPDLTSYVCGRCGQRHDSVPFAYAFNAPAYWSRTVVGEDDCVLEEELCIIRGESYFVRARILIPVTDADTDFEWGVWVSLSLPNFTRMLDLWSTPGRESEEPYFGSLSSAIPIYEPTTVELKTHVHTRPVGERPLLELEPTDHPLAVEQRTGITAARVRQIAEEVMHAQ